MAARTFLGNGGIGRRGSQAAAAVWLWLCVSAAHALPADVAALHARYDALRAAFVSSPFKQPLVLVSAPHGDALKGDVYAVIEQPFGVAGPALQERTSWCDVLILHLNTKRCQVKPGAGSGTIAMVVGRKFEQPASAGKTVEFGFRVLDARPDYVRVQMATDGAPADVRDQVVLQAAALDDRRTFVHVTYSYVFGTSELWAMQAYLATLGRNKVGFTVAGAGADGKASHVRGVRGMVERNAMRYYLAVVAYVESLAVPPPQRLDKRLHGWFDATERHALQLHELDRDEYLKMKRNETRGMP